MEETQCSPLPVNGPRLTPFVLNDPFTRHAICGEGYFHLFCGVIYRQSVGGIAENPSNQKWPTSKIPNPRYSGKAGARTKGKAADSCPKYVIPPSCILVICYLVGTAIDNVRYRVPWRRDETERSAEGDSGRLREKPSLSTIDQCLTQV